MISDYSNKFVGSKKWGLDNAIATVDGENYTAFSSNDAQKLSCNGFSVVPNGGQDQLILGNAS